MDKLSEPLLSSDNNMSDSTAPAPKTISVAPKQSGAGSDTGSAAAAGSGSGGGDMSASSSTIKTSQVVPFTPHSAAKVDEHQRLIPSSRPQVCATLI